MEKTSHSSPSATTNAVDGRATCALGDGGDAKMTSNSIQSSLRSLNRASHKISKPIPKNSDPVAARIAAVPATAAPAGARVGSSGGAPAYQPQPPVYNIDKSSFRDVVQKLTGSPAHPRTRPSPAEPSSCPPAAAAAAVPTSRLHRIRPPPLPHLLQRPPPPVMAPMHALDPWTRPQLSPLPPLPAVSAAAESPISAYMRCIRGGAVPLPTAGPATPPPPSSPLGFGCLLSPRTAYQMMMAAPGMGLSTSPGVQLPSPRLGDP